ncbi:30S ribosomal protein S16 [Geodia barretti]|uniref:Small ribosomal subunit protein bS16m n=1 Tax=Geodia barretti TaxID=519541 RepID=A0AA35TKC4_GEOBA|nr:30S ribosomal protein S16 [Geodia barretti]
MEVIGHYNPTSEPETIELDRQRLQHWLDRGAQLTDTVRTLVARHPEAAVDNADAAAVEAPPAAEPPPTAEAAATAERDCPKNRRPLQSRRPPPRRPPRVSLRHATGPRRRWRRREPRRATSSRLWRARSWSIPRRLSSQSRAAGRDARHTDHRRR